MSYYSDLPLNQRSAIDILSAGGDWKHAAAGADVTLRTMYRWREDDKFKKALSEAIHGIFEDNTRNIATGMTEALEHLRERLESDITDPQHKDKIAIVMLKVGQSAQRMLELADIQQELEEIKSRLPNAEEN